MIVLCESDYCRLCGLEDEENEEIEYQDITLGLPRKPSIVKLSQLLDDSLGFNINAETIYPKKICPDCKKCVQMCSEFLEKIRYGQEVLQKILDQDDAKPNMKMNFCAKRKEDAAGITKVRRGRPKKGFEKKTLKITDYPISRQSDKRKRRIPKHLNEFDTSNVESSQAKYNSSLDYEFQQCQKNEEKDYIDKVFNDAEPVEIRTNLKENQFNLLSNKKRRGGEFMYRCSVLTCEMLLRNKSELASHQKMTGHEGIITLTVFQPVDNQEVDYKDGMKSASKEMETEPKFCSENQLDRRKVTSDCIDNNPDEGSYTKNSITQRTMENKSKMSQNDKDQHSNVILCEICFESFSSFIALRNHRNNVHKLKEGKNYSCTECERVFSAPSSLSYHRDSVHRKSQYKCKYEGCEKVFKVANLLTRHLQSHENKRPFSCEICYKSFKRYANMKAHLSIHSESDKTFCDVCGQSFKHSSSLKLHMKLHSGEKQFVCKYCSKAFTQNGNLKEHIRTHTGEKPYKCALCNKGFATCSQMKSHSKRHNNGSKPYSCGECFRRFLHLDTLRIHMRKHSNPLQDPCMPKRCTDVSDKNAEYRCKVCDLEFDEEAILSNHILSHNNVCDIKNTVWSILDDATDKSVRKGFSEQEQDVQHVIYIAYDDKSTNDQIDSTATSTKDQQQIKLPAPLSIDTMTFSAEYFKDLRNIPVSE